VASLVNAKVEKKHDDFISLGICLQRVTDEIDYHNGVILAGLLVPCVYDLEIVDPCCDPPAL